MTNIDDEWEQFMMGGKSSTQKPVANPINIDIIDDCDADDDDAENANIHTYKGRDLYISTKTKKPFLNVDDKIDILSLFWKIPVIEYWVPEPGVLKKQMKVVCNTEAESEALENNKQNQYFCKDKKIVKQTENANRRTKYKDERIISVGICTKDVMTCRSKESGGAMYNCIALTLRCKNQENRFIEIHVKIFNTGKLEIPGILNVELYENIKTFLLSILAPYFLPHVLDYLPPTSDNVIINSNFYVGFNINRDVLHNILRSAKYNMDSIYESCTYPAVKTKFYFYNDYGFDKTKQKGVIREEDAAMKTADIIKSDKYTKISFMVFRTGSCLIVGNCTEEILVFVYEFVKQLLLDERERIYMAGEETPPETKKSKNNTKLRKRKVMVTSPYLSALKRLDG